MREMPNFSSSYDLQMFVMEMAFWNIDIPEVLHTERVSEGEKEPLYESVPNEVSFSETPLLINNAIQPLTFIDEFLSKDISNELRASEIIQDLHQKLGPLTVEQINLNSQENVDATKTLGKFEDHATGLKIEGQLESGDENAMFKGLVRIIDI